MTFRRSLSFALALAGLCLSAVAAHADSLTLTLSNSSQSGAPGSTVAYSATVTAASSNTGLIYLNSDAYSVSGTAALDDSAFLSTFPVFLSAGQSYTGTLFSLLLPGTAANTSTGSFSILGGADAAALSTLASTNFSVTTTAATAATPEPSSMVLCATGLLGAVTAMRRRRMRETAQTV